MAIYPAMGTSPIAFVDGNQSQQELPLSAVFFSANGADASSWPSFAANQATITALLQQLVAYGYLTAGTQTASALPAATITANQPGAAGNQISVAFSAASPAAGTLTATLNATQTYLGLTAENLTTTLQTTAAAAATAGDLVYVEPGTIEMPIAYSGPVGVVPTDAFTLAATDASYTIQVVVTIDPPPISPNPQTFTLVVTGSKAVAGTTLSALETSPQPFELLVTFAGPVGPLPSTGKVTLAGGADAVAASGSTPATPAVAASASIYAAS
jgi:hypothetical protein